MLFRIKLKPGFFRETSSNFIRLTFTSKYYTSSVLHEKYAESYNQFERNDSNNYTQREIRNPSPQYPSYANQRFKDNFGYKKQMYSLDWHSKLFRNNMVRDLSLDKLYVPGDKINKIERIPLPMEKFFYAEHPDVASRLEEEVENYRKSVNISVKGENIPKPITKFSELCLPENLMNALNTENFSEPTPVQAQGWPVALSGRDMIGVSQTGSGKTLGYMLPAVIHAVNKQYTNPQRGDCKPRVLVLGPTRDLIQQIYRVSEKFIKACGLIGATVYGGASKKFQLRSLKGAEICIATPGRLLDFLVEQDVSLSNCSYLVLDEADRMLDMGFEPQIREIIKQIPTDCQVLMWSATWPFKIRKLAEDFLNNFIHVTVGSGKLTANPNIQQNIYVVSEDEKKYRLYSLLKSIWIEKGKVLVFAATRGRVDHLTDSLRQRFDCFSVHGGISQSRRDEVLYKFRSKRSCVLFATDIAARGLDITDIDHVINYDFPSSIEQYIHRIGRTARGSAHGVSHSFFTKYNVCLVKNLLRILENSNQPINPKLYSLSNNKRTSHFIDSMEEEKCLDK